MSQKGLAHYADAEPLAQELLNLLLAHLDGIRLELTGEMRRRTETVSRVEILAGTKKKQLAQKTIEEATLFELLPAQSGPYTMRGTFTGTDLNWLIRFVDPWQFENKLMIFTGSGNHLARVTNDKSNLYQFLLENQETDEKQAYKAFGMPYLVPELREGGFELNYTTDSTLPELLNLEDIRGPLHNHSKYSDGKNTIRELAEYCIGKGYEYLGLSDHSKSAFYANGLREFDIIRQHEEIDALNKELAPFKIFKGIESDILNDGSLDYDKDVLASFDFIVASVHSNLNMDIEKATARLLKAIENPYTTMLGHPTGRLLLRRPGYPIDYKKVIDACARNEVIIEINANPWRLDLDWRWVHYALERGVLLSINPDAHEIEGFDDMKFGVYVGRKGGLTMAKTFNTWDLGKVDEYLTARKLKGK